MQTTRTTSGRETITSTVVREHRYIGRSAGHNNGASWVVGPVLVDVIIETHESDRRPTIDPTYSVVIDDRPQFCGPARLLDADAFAGRACRFTMLDLVPLDDEQLAAERAWELRTHDMNV